MRNKTPLLEKITSWVGSGPSLIAHSALFLTALILSLFGVIEFDRMLLILTTFVSLEAIYLAIFIQMTVNRNTQSLIEVEEDLEEITEDVEDIQENIEELGEDVEDIQENIEEITEDVEDIQEDIEEITEDVEDIQEDIEELGEDETSVDGTVTLKPEAVTALEDEIKRLQAELAKLKGNG